MEMVARNGNTYLHAPVSAWALNSDIFLNLDILHIDQYLLSGERVYSIYGLIWITNTCLQHKMVLLEDLNLLYFDFQSCVLVYTKENVQQQTLAGIS